MLKMLCLKGDANIFFLWFLNVMMSSLMMMMKLTTYSWWFGLNLTPVSRFALCWANAVVELCFFDCVENSLYGRVCNCRWHWKWQGPVSTARTSEWSSAWTPPPTATPPTPARAVCFGHVQTDASSLLCVLPSFHCDINGIKTTFIWYE